MSWLICRCCGLPRSECRCQRPRPLPQLTSQQLPSWRLQLRVGMAPPLLVSLLQQQDQWLQRMLSHPINPSFLIPFCHRIYRKAARPPAQALLIILSMPDLPRSPEPDRDIPSLLLSFQQRFPQLAADRWPRLQLAWEHYLELREQDPCPTEIRLRAIASEVAQSDLDRALQLILLQLAGYSSIERQQDRTQLLLTEAGKLLTSSPS